MEKEYCKPKQSVSAFNFCVKCNNTCRSNQLQYSQKRDCVERKNVPSNIFSMIRGKNLLITGATGSIGKSILKQVIEYKPNSVTLLSRDEYKQSQLKKLYDNIPNIDFQLGDVRYLNQLTRVCKNQEIIFHTAALKDILSDELNPREAIETNVIGTRNLIDAAIEQNVGKVVNISTDKAVYPTSVLGGTKMLSERLITNANKKQKNTIFCNVRFGNVIGSRGSVIPIMVNQIRKKRRATITDPAMTRFMMTLDEAVQLVLHAATISEGGETMVLKMKSVRIEELIEAIKSIVAKKYGLDSKLIDTKVIGSRDGEKIHEMLLSNEELHYVTETDNFLIVKQKMTQNKSQNFDKKWIYSNTTDQFSFSEISKIVSKYLESGEKNGNFI